MSEVESKECNLKKKLQIFLGDLQKFGTTHGFKHFSCYLRGKEELVVSVRNNLPSTPSHNASRKQSLHPTDSLSSACLPYDKTTLTLSYNTQVGLSGLQDKGIGLPPASPSEEEPSAEGDVTKFLIAGYARYSCPYVWVRSNHDRLMRLSGNSDQERDCPLKLKSTGKWQDKDVNVFEIIAELVKLSTYPPPRNPFEVDFGFFHNLSHPTQLLATSAMLNSLDKLVMVIPDTKPYSTRVFEDLQQLAKLHFSSLQDLIDNGKAPIIQQHRQQHQEQQKQQKSRQRHAAPWSSQHHSSYPTIPPYQSSTSNPTSVLPTAPINASPVFYGRGAGGVFPGGFERTPAPTMF